MGRRELFGGRVQAGVGAEAAAAAAPPVVSPEAYLRLCADWVRAVLVAHQRRGESDLVAHWLVQVLALDPAAPEWQHVLAPPG